MNVSVVVTSYNGATWIGAALEAALAQTLPPAEVIVVNDGSTDETAAVVAGFAPRVRRIDQANAGCSAARNRGVEVATGDVIAFLDDDDIWLPKKLERQVALLQSDTEIGAVFCPNQNFAHEDETILLETNRTSFDFLPSEPARVSGARVLNREIQFPAALDNNFALPSTLAVRANILRKVGPFEQKLRYAEDWELLLRLCLTTQLAYCSETLVRRRIRTASLSAKGKDARDLLVALDTLPERIELPAPARTQWEDMRAELSVHAAHFSRKDGERAMALKFLTTAFRNGPLIGARRFGWQSKLRGIRELAALAFGRR
jgi:glycosyltransferase involved in cell wall biosynthesis